MFYFLCSTIDQCWGRGESHDVAENERLRNAALIGEACKVLEKPSNNFCENQTTRSIPTHHQSIFPMHSLFPDEINYNMENRPAGGLQKILNLCKHVNCLKD